MNMDVHHRILELYSGIGGMHCAWNASGLMGEVIAAVDINTVANNVYKTNFPKTNLMTKNIQSITSKQIVDWHIDTILMSPPCQPFTRNGKYLDSSDTRTNSFIYLINMLDKLVDINYILMENVKGFECSTVRNLFINKLKECNFSFQEFLLCPTTVGIPNSRLRYYCLARRTKSLWKFNRKDHIVQSLPGTYEEPYCLEQILETSVPDHFLVPDKHLKRGKVFDICLKSSKRSCCFTKAYSHYVDGTGSVYTEASKEVLEQCCKKANSFNVGSDEFIATLRELKLRFFTPKEILLLMSFHKGYTFPETTTKKQCYRLLGNSVNVKVISELLKILYA